MSISADITIKRQEALERVFKRLMSQQEELVRKAVNSMSNDDLAGYLHSELYFYHVEGKGRLKESWEKSDEVR